MAALTDNPPTPATQPKSRRLRRWIYVVGSIVLLAVAGIFGSRIYVQLREERIVRKARDFIEKKDYGQALIAAQWALQVSPRNISANRLMAELADLAGSPQAVFWHRSVAELQPGVAENHFKWAESSLRSSNAAMAGQALAKVPDAAKNTPAYHELAGRVTQASNKPDEAATHFAEAVRLDPANEKYRFGLATVRLESSDPALQEEGRAVIEKFRAKPEFRQRAHRTLIQDHFRRSEWKEGFLLAAELQARTDAPFEDRMLLLDLLRKFQRPELHAYLMDVQIAAARNSDHAAALIGWLNRNTMTLIAADWSKTLPEVMRSRNPVLSAIAESYANLGDWKRLKPLLEQGTWENNDFMRLALLTRVLREEDDQLSSRVRWNEAIKSAAARPEDLAQLARFAEACKWDTESVELLWQLTRGRNDQWALASLERKYAEKANARGLLNVATRRLELDPRDFAAQNNVAALSFTLNVNVDHAQALAREAYNQRPDNPAAASTYAYALHLLGKTEDGLKIMRTLDGRLLKSPSFAANFGILLADGGTAEEAATYLDIARSGRLLPEELELVMRARARSGQPLRPR